MYLKNVLINGVKTNKQKGMAMRTVLTSEVQMELKDSLCSYLLKLSVWDVLSLIFHASLASSGDQHCWHPEILFLSTIEEKSAGMNHGGLRHRCHMASLFSVELRPLGCPAAYKGIIATLCCCSVITQGTHWNKLQLLGRNI